MLTVAMFAVYEFDYQLKRQKMVYARRKKKGSWIMLLCLLRLDMRGKGNTLFCSKHGCWVNISRRIWSDYYKAFVWDEMFAAVAAEVVCRLRKA